ncbi:MAG TPA: endo-1,4-beta-xylanase [Caulobacteraceae bacterium]
MSGRRGAEGPSRRAFVGSAVALAACQPAARGQPAGRSLPPLRAVAPFPVGSAIQAEQIDDPDLAALIAAQVSQVTPEWQMKMEYIVGEGGALRFDAPDRIASFAAAKGLRLHGHTLIWYAQTPAAFEALDSQPGPFRDAYANYITTVVGRYRGRAASWDVVNEAVAEDGAGLRDSLWSRRLGAIEHMRLAYELAHAADPVAILFLNDYNLEYLPAKRACFLRLAETLLKAGAPLGGLGTQTHVGLDLPAGAIAAGLSDLASLGLPLHISEMDVSTARFHRLFSSSAELAARQGAVYAEAAKAMAGLPAAQRYALTLWGLRDRDSWRVRENRADTPLLFDDLGRAKPALADFEAALSR